MKPCKGYEKVKDKLYPPDCPIIPHVTECPD